MFKKLPQSFYRDFLFLWVCFFLSVIAGVAQSPVFRNYTPKDGLPSNEAYCVMQDSRGFIWIGTDGGVSRFDGYRFQNFTLAQGLADNTIFGMQEDRHGRIWFRSLSGKLSYWDNDSIYPIGANDSIGANMSGVLMISFYIDSGDTIWCGLRAGKGFFKIAPGYGAKDFKMIRPKQSCYYVSRIEPGRYIFGNVYRKSPLDSTLRLFTREVMTRVVEEKEMVAYNLLCMPMGGDSLLISENKGLFVLNGTTARPVALAASFFRGRVACLKTNALGYWCSVFGKGIVKLEWMKNGAVRRTDSLLYGKTVTDMMIDREGGTWFSTLEHGLFYQGPGYFTWVLNRTGRLGNNLSYGKFGEYFLVSNEKDKMDLLSPDTLITGIDLRKQSSWEFLKVERSTGNSFVLNTGASLTKGEVRSYWFRPGISPLQVRDSAGFFLGLWQYASSGDAIYLADRFDLYTIVSGGIAKKLSALPMRTYSLYLDMKGVLWLGTVNGLWSYSKGKFVYHGKEHPLLTNRINHILAGPDGTWYMATHGNGLLVKKGDHIRQLTVDAGLPSNNCECLLLDRFNTLWIGTKNGLCSMDLNEDRLRVSAYNLGSDQLSQKVEWLEQCGNTLWIVTDQTVLRHALPLRHDSLLTPPVFITRFSVNGIVQKQKSNPVFDHDQTDIRIAYVGLQFQRFGNIRYAYQLEGLDSAWHVTTSTNINYPFLPPGRYTFRVKALDGIGEDRQDEVYFTILPPWWKTWWALSISSACTVILLYVLVASRIRGIRKREEEKTALHTQVANIEMKALRAQMNPHFIFNAINSIQNHIIKNDRKTAQDYLAKFARLIRNVLENSKSEQIPLIREIETLGLYIELEQLRVQGKFTYKINVDPSIPVYDALIPPLLLQPFVENSIQHGLLPLEGREGHILISIKRAHDQLVCTIDDNGIGRAKAAERKKDRGSAYRSLGLSVTEERIDIINRFNKGVAGIVFEDKIDGTGNATGTKVILTVPFVTETLQR